MLYKLQLKNNTVVSNNVLYQILKRSDGNSRVIIQMNDKIMYDQVVQDADEFIKTSLEVLGDYGCTLVPGDIYDEPEECAAGAFGCKYSENGCKYEQAEN